MGAFWNNPTETFVDVYEEGGGKVEKGKGTHWMSESGTFDLFLLGGGPRDSSEVASMLYSQYASLTGYQALPPLFSLGYHQCRWNYKDTKDVLQVHDKFEEHDYPYDVLWLDIEHTDGKRYFTWDPRLFPDPTAMQGRLWEQGRRMVTIVDPQQTKSSSRRPKTVPHSPVELKVEGGDPSADSCRLVAPKAAEGAPCGVALGARVTPNDKTLSQPRGLSQELSSDFQCLYMF